MINEDKIAPNEWVKENYPDGVVTLSDDGKMYVEWDLLLELMVLYAGHCIYEIAKAKKRNNDRDQT